MTKTEGKSKEISASQKMNSKRDAMNTSQTTSNHMSKCNSTELSKHIWKDQKRNNYKIECNIICETEAYKNCTKKRHLCIFQKFYIICNPESSRNTEQYNELASTV